MLSSALVFAQTRTLRGTVRDAQGAPVPFATVSEAGTKNAVQADANGNYSINVGANASITFSATGYSAITRTEGGIVTLARNEAQ